MTGMFFIWHQENSCPDPEAAMNSFSPMKKILSCIMKIIVIASAVSGTFLSWYAGRVLDLGYAAEGAGPLPNHDSRKPLSETVTYL